MQEIVVSASMEPLILEEVSGSVTIISREDIERRQAQYLIDVLRDVPGFAASQAGGVGSQTQLRVRGSEANHLLVLIDGVRANDPALGDEYQFQYALASNIERIEVIRGPQSAIWGADALGGVVNIIRRHDVPKSYVTGTAETGSFDSSNLGVHAGIAGRRVYASGGIAHAESDGTNIARAGDEDDGLSNTTADLTLGYEPVDALRLSLSARHVDSSSEFDDIDFFVTGLPVDADRVTDAKRTYLGGVVDYSPDASPLTSRLSINWTDTDNVNVYDGVWDSSSGAESLEFDLRTSLRFGPSADARHRLTLAMDHETTDFAQRGQASFFGDPNQDQSYHVTGYAFEYAAMPSGNFNWSLSARYDDFSHFDNAIALQLGGAWRINDTLRVRGALGTGSKAPTFTERFGFFPGSFIGNPELQPETSRAWEVGVDKVWLGDRLRLGVTYFDQNLEDEIDGFVFDPDAGLFTARNRTSDSARSGVEVEFVANVTDLLTLRSAYSYTDATEFDAARGVDVREIRRPKHSASLNLHYNLLRERASLNLNAHYNGRQVDTFFSPTTFTAEEVAIAQYLTVNLAAAWHLTPAIELFGRIDNITDDAHEDILGFSLPGRAAYLGFRTRVQW